MDDRSFEWELAELLLVEDLKERGGLELRELLRAAVLAYLEGEYGARVFQFAQAMLDVLVDRKLVEAGTLARLKIFCEAAQALENLGALPPRVTERSSNE